LAPAEVRRLAPSLCRWPRRARTHAAAHDACSPTLPPAPPIIPLFSPADQSPRGSIQPSEGASGSPLQALLAALNYGTSSGGGRGSGAKRVRDARDTLLESSDDEAGASGGWRVSSSGSSGGAKRVKDARDTLLESSDDEAGASGGWASGSGGGASASGAAGTEGAWVNDRSNGYRFN